MDSVAWTFNAALTQCSGASHLVADTFQMALAELRLATSEVPKLANPPSALPAASCAKMIGATCVQCQDGYNLESDECRSKLLPHTLRPAGLWLSGAQLRGIHLQKMCRGILS